MMVYIEFSRGILFMHLTSVIIYASPALYTGTLSSTYLLPRRNTASFKEVYFALWQHTRAE